MTIHYPTNSTAPLRRIVARINDLKTLVPIPRFFQDQGYEIHDLREQSGIAELTGALVIDRLRNIGYCGLSERADKEGALAMHDAFDLDLSFVFDLKPEEYHTNVIMSVLAGRACVLQPDAIADDAVTQAIADAFTQSILMLSDEEKQAFAGNCIALTDRDLFMSERAADGLRGASRTTLEQWGFAIRSAPLDEIEKAGGSLRCMVAEIF